MMQIDKPIENKRDRTAIGFAFHNIVHVGGEMINSTIAKNPILV